MTRICALRTAAVEIGGDDGESKLRLGGGETPLSEPLGAIALALRYAQLERTGAERWLPPGRHAGKHITADSLAGRLKRHGIDRTREGRHAALLALAARLPAPILAERVGIHQGRAAPWVRLAGASYGGYVGFRSGSWRRLGTGTVRGVSSGTSLPTLPIVTAGGAQRRRLVVRARRLTQLALGWHVLEAGVGVGAGVVAGSVALVGFGADSLIEAAAGLVVLWLVTGERLASPRAERRAQQLIAISFGLLAVYVTVASLRDLVGGHHPAVSWVGIGLSVVTLLAMPPLAEAKRRVGRALGSSAAISESRQTMLCAYLSAALLIGLLANAVAGWWWADPLVALVIGAVAVRETRDAWRGESCGCC